MREMLDKISSPQKPARLEAAIVPDVWVEPRFVVEIAQTRSRVVPCTQRGEEKAGWLRLRFPRIINFVREDRTAEDAQLSKSLGDVCAARTQEREATDEVSS